MRTRNIMLHQQNTQPSAERPVVPSGNVKTEIIRVTGQRTEFYVEKCARAQEMQQNAANKSYFQVFKPFHLGLSGTINGTVVVFSQYRFRCSNQVDGRVGVRYQDQFANKGSLTRSSLGRGNLLRLGYSNLTTTRPVILHRHIREIFLQ